MAGESESESVAESGGESQSESKNESLTPPIRWLGAIYRGGRGDRNWMGYVIDVRTEEDAFHGRGDVFVAPPIPDDGLEEVVGVFGSGPEARHAVLEALKAKWRERMAAERAANPPPPPPPKRAPRKRKRRLVQ